MGHVVGWDFAANRLRCLGQTDLWFHTYVLLVQQGLTPDEIWSELRSRRGERP